MNKLVVTHYNKKILEAFFVDGVLMDIMVFDKETNLDNIYIGKVENVVKNLDACFIDIGTGLPCYYSLHENQHIFLNSKNDDKVKAGDELLIQIVKDAIKTKNPVASAELSLRGEFVVVNTGKKIGISNKITSGKTRDRLREIARENLPCNFGCIVRTSAAECPKEVLVGEIKLLYTKLQEILDTAKYRTCFSCLYKSKAAYIDYFITKFNANLSDIITDDEEIYHAFLSYLEEKKLDSVTVTKYVDENCSLLALYNLKKEVENAMKQKVWLKSGAYLVIEQTEAMVVIDVNTGKSVNNKNLEQHLLQVNSEAAVEVCRQLRLRNLSGMILIDFINMKTPGHMNMIQDILIEELKKDSVPAKFVDITKLGLVELTRKKIRRSLREQVVIRE